MPPDAAALGIEPGWIDAAGGLRLRPDFWPERGGMDGFYAACLDASRALPRDSASRREDKRPPDTIGLRFHTRMPCPDPL